MYNEEEEQYAERPFADRAEDEAGQRNEGQRFDQFPSIRESKKNKAMRKTQWKEGRGSVKEQGLNHLYDRTREYRGATSERTS